MSEAFSRLEFELRRRGAVTARELVEVLKISQPTVSRLLARIGRHRLLRFGRGRATRYALARTLGGLGESWPLYWIDETGKAHHAGVLYALEGRQWALVQDEPWETLRGTFFPEGVYPDLPWYLDDLRPQGFLGRAFAHRHGHELGLPLDPRVWRADDVVMALLRHGGDLQGSFILGQAMLSSVQERRFSVWPAIDVEDCPSVYRERAEAALAGEWPGSSAAGEQPKFTATVRDSAGAGRHVIVKFSGRTETPAARRWADLLRAEHHAAVLLGANGIAAAETRLLEAGGRCFLESTRFDRVGAHGRRGLVSLAALDSAFFGRLDTPWTAASRRLLGDGWVTEAGAEQLDVLWWFGALIGNSDMHYGNVSLFLTRSRPLSLAPAYDMLPMMYRPDQEGGLPDRTFAPGLPPPEAVAVWSRASGMAELFWRRIAEDPAITSSFRSIAEVNAAVITGCRQQVGC